MCLSAREHISGTTHAIVKPNFLCMLPMAVARSCSSTLTIGCIAYRREGSDGSAQHGRSVIYDCLVILFCFILCGRLCWLFVSFWVHVNIFHQVVSYHINKYCQPVTVCKGTAWRWRQRWICWHEITQLNVTRKGAARSNESADTLQPI